MSSLADNQRIIDQSDEVARTIARQCGNCAFCTSVDDGTGYCQRFPPHWTGDESEFPVVRVNEWCGEFQPSIAANQAKLEELRKNPPDRYPWKV